MKKHLLILAILVSIIFHAVQVSAFTRYVQYAGVCEDNRTVDAIATTYSKEYFYTYSGFVENAPGWCVYWILQACNDFVKSRSTAICYEVESPNAEDLMVQPLTNPGLDIETFRNPHLVTPILIHTTPQPQPTPIVKKHPDPTMSQRLFVVQVTSLYLIDKYTPNFVKAIAKAILLVGGTVVISLATPELVLASVFLILTPYSGNIKDEADKKKFTEIRNELLKYPAAKKYMGHKAEISKTDQTITIDGTQIQVIYNADETASTVITKVGTEESPLSFMQGSELMIDKNGDWVNESPTCTKGHTDENGKLVNDGGC
jgi:hypothetical protein